MLGIKDLQRAHRQKPSWSLRRHYRKKEANQYLKLSCSCWSDFLKIDVFENALANKRFVEEAVNRFMQKYWDVWDMMTFSERNHLFLAEHQEKLLESKHFEWEKNTIIIPFFSKELNRIYWNEPLVLAYDQYFKLYRDFSDQIIDVNNYAHKPYQAKMSSAKWVAAQDNSFVLYWDTYRVFLYYKEGAFISYIPLDIEVKEVSDEQQGCIAQKIMKEDELELIDYLVKESLCRKSFVKKYERRKRRNKK